MKKAVKLHEDFKLAIKILRTKGMDAKKGRLLLKRHYVALLEQEGDKDAVKCKVSDLKQMFWSNEALVTKYITAHHGEDDDDDEENYDDDDDTMMDNDSEDDERATEEVEFDVGDEVDLVPVDVDAWLDRHDTAYLVTREMRPPGADPLVRAEPWVITS